MPLLAIGTSVTTPKDQPHVGTVQGTRHNTTETLVRWHRGYATWEPTTSLTEVKTEWRCIHCDRLDTDPRDPASRCDCRFKEVPCA